jgi:RimJ/RimL family protein N-acetyltransferase
LTGLPERPLIPTLTDGVIVLKRRTMADVGAQMAGQDSEIMKWLEWDKPTLENVTEMIESSARSWDTNDGRCDFGVYDTSTNALVGNCRANFADPLLHEHEVNVGYAVFAPWRGTGLGTRIVHVLRGWIEQSDPIRTAVLKIDTGNVASNRVAERCGFVPDGPVSVENSELIRWVRQRLNKRAYFVVPDFGGVDKDFDLIAAITGQSIERLEV